MGVAKDSDEGFWRKRVTDFRYLTLVRVVFYLAFLKCFRRYSCGGLGVVATPKAVSYRVYVGFRLTCTLNIDHWDTQYPPETLHFETTLSCFRSGKRIEYYIKSSRNL